MKGYNVIFLKVCIKSFFIFLLFSILEFYLSDTILVFLKAEIYLLSVAGLTLYICRYIMRGKKISFLENRRDRILKKTFQKSDRYPIYYKKNGKDFIISLELLLDTINESEWKKFEDRNFKIIIGSGSEIWRLCKFRKIDGLFDLFNKTIVICLRKDTLERYRNGDIEIVHKVLADFYHEWGHFVDFIHDNISFTSSFVSIFTREREIFLSNLKLIYQKNFYKSILKNSINGLYAYTSPAEFFADNYQKYKLKSYVPVEVLEIFRKLEAK